MKNKGFVSISDYSKSEILSLLQLAEEFEKNPNQDLLRGKVIASLFFEPSTRTRLSFESAITRLGGRIIGFSDANTSSSTKGETLKDTILIVSNYCDLIVMRHPLEGTAKYASEIASVPIVNAGDGANQHPSQTMLDLFSIKKTQGGLENLEVALVGDLKYGRTVHSLIMALSHFSPKFQFVSPPELELPVEYKMFLKQRNIPFEEHADLNKSLKNSDIVYMTRVQKERFSDLMEYEQTKNAFVLKESMLSDTKDNLRILHPLPRVNEICTSVDENSKAYYFTQALNGVYTRQAIICNLLGIK